MNNAKSHFITLLPDEKCLFIAYAFYCEYVGSSSIYKVTIIGYKVLKKIHFDFIICSAVLHFCENREHFRELFKEIVRVLRPNGIFWFRMTTKHKY